MKNLKVFEQNDQTEQKTHPKQYGPPPIFNLWGVNVLLLLRKLTYTVLNSPNLCEDVQTNVLDCNFKTLVELINNEFTEKNHNAPMHLFQLANRVVS